MFRLTPYADAARQHTWTAVRELAVAQSDLLQDLGTRTVDKLPVSVVSDGRGNSIELAPIPIALSIEFETDPLVAGNLAAFYSAVNETAAQHRDDLERAMISTLSDVTEMTGNTTDAGGGGLSWDLLTEAMEKIDMAFDPQGKPAGISLLLHPDDYVKLLAMAESSPPTEAQAKRHADMLERKHAKWLSSRRKRRL